MKGFALPHNHGDTENTDKFHSELLKSEQFENVSEIFKQLSDPTRVKIFWLLSHREECVMNISAMLEMSSPAVSHHLRSMYECGLLISERKDKEVYYKTADTEESRLLHKTVEQIMEITCPKDLPCMEESPKEVIYKVHRYLLEHIPDRITIQELSKKFLMNTTTLKSTFKEVYGNSIAAHINEHRMEYAEELLKKTNTSISEISKAVGYESQSRFSSAFKSIYNMTPSEFRKLKPKTVHHDIDFFES